MSYNNAKEYILKHKDTYSKGVIKKILVNHGYNANIVEQIYSELGYNNKDDEISNHNLKSFFTAFLGTLMLFIYLGIKIFFTNILFKTIIFVVLIIIGIVFTIISLKYFFECNEKKSLSKISLFINIFNIFWIIFSIIILILSIFFLGGSDPFSDEDIIGNNQTQSDIKILQIYSTNTDDGVIDGGLDTINILLKLENGNLPFKNEDISINLKKGSDEQSLTYIEGFANTKDYNITYITGESIMEEYISLDEVVMMIFVSDYDINTQENLKLEFILENKIVKSIEFDTPEKISFDETYIYP
ncbi:MAG: hypothetical protein PF569_07730 [Candidatus Woesearchaeota archaeon]|jgi:hypothetical protein|nr:hypothetical protein [Candidatus Woesearchaeota archaeon]